MKQTYKRLFVAGLLAGCGLVATAQTAPAPMPVPAAAPMAREHDHGERHGRADPAKMQERMAKRLAEMKQKLQLSGAQESAWTAWTASMKPAAFKRPDRGEMEKLTTPERIDRMRAMRSARMAEMDKRADATKTFYAALSTEQKKTYDTLTARGHHGGPPHHKG